MCVGLKAKIYKDNDVKSISMACVQKTLSDGALVNITVDDNEEDSDVKNTKIWASLNI